MSSLEERLQRVEALEEIRLLLTEYGRALDRRDLETYASLFARDGEWTGPYVGSAKGPAAIRALLEKNLAPAPVGAHHILSNMMIQVDGDAATAWSRWTYVTPGSAQEPSLAISGRYDDVLVRENGRWRFRSRTVSGDLAAGR